MCTLSIFRDNDTLKITMNRDEHLERLGEKMPFAWNGAFVAPQDLKSKGTWIGVHPKTQQWACLLNGYDERDESIHDQPLSRGHIIPEFLTQDFDQFRTYISDNSDRFASFRLLCGDKVSLFEIFWDGETLNIQTPDINRGWLFRSSSSLEQQRVIEYRQGLFEAWLERPEYICNGKVPSFHAVCNEDAPSSSILMRRESLKRATTSITSIHMQDNTTEVSYFSANNQNDSRLLPLTIADINESNTQLYYA
ncbi:MAG: NRDE family protein [Bdellovibrionales bacterium]